MLDNGPDVVIVDGAGERYRIVRTEVLFWLQSESDPHLFVECSDRDLRSLGVEINGRVVQALGDDKSERDAIRPVIERHLALVRPLRAVAWELRTAWATGRRVALSLERADLDRLEGHVSRVSPTDALVVISGTHVPLDRVLAVHLPSRLGDSTARAGEFHGAPQRAVLPGQQEWVL